MVCLMFTGVAAVFTYFYNFDERFSYAELRGYIVNKTNSCKSEKGSDEGICLEEQQ